MSDLFSIREQMMWFKGREYALSCNLSLSFCKYRLMGISPVIALILSDGNVLNAPNIYKAALLYSFPNVFKG